MAKVFIEEATLTAIGDAIRGKTGKTELLDPANMGTEISGIETGGDIEVEPIVLSGDCSYACRGAMPTAYINLFGDTISTEGITNASSMFSKSSLEEIPFQINVSNCVNFNDMFTSSVLKACPKVRGTISWGTGTSYWDTLLDCYYLRDVEDLFTSDMLEGFSTVKVTSAYSVPRPLTFRSCHSLRSIPSWWYKFKLNEESTSFPNKLYSIYYFMLNYCYSLDEAINIPVWKCQAAQTSDMLGSSFARGSRLKNITFETNEDGSAIETNWKTQTMDLSDAVGYAHDPSFILNYNNGITADKQVTDDATYQALKDDPDWFTSNTAYSRYNHDSAVATINSLPDTSAYLATAGGTNTIKFRGESGSATDGGAINTLTEEEIAVAAAKGWTVTLV